MLYVGVEVDVRKWFVSKRHIGIGAWPKITGVEILERTQRVSAISHHKRH
jgi:hypothetical protein